MLHLGVRPDVSTAELCAAAQAHVRMHTRGMRAWRGTCACVLAAPVQVAAATSATMVMATSLSACTVYIGLGTLFEVQDYAVVLSGLGFAATLCGQVLMAALSRAGGGSRRSRERRNTALILRTMAVLMVGSAVAMGYSAFLELRRLWEHPQIAREFGHICD